MHLAVGEFEVDGETYFTGIVHDLSARKSAEQALQQAMKMEAIGQLTGGVAHDFNKSFDMTTRGRVIAARQRAASPSLPS